MRNLIIAACLFLPSATLAQDLPIFDGSQFGKVVVTDNQSALGEIRNEALIGGLNIEFVSNYSASSPFAQLGRAVGKLDILTDTNKYAPCTAFLIADNRLVTNYHCVPGVLDHPQIGGTAVAALQVHFGFIRDGIKGDTKSFNVSPVPLEVNKALDYTVLKVLGDPNSEFGALELSATVPEARAPFWVIGHPLGEAQRISREKCQASAPAIEGTRVLHTCDTMPGSSGSPVIDAGLRQVIALHSASAGSVNLAVSMAEIIEASSVLVGFKPDADPEEDREIVAFGLLSDALSRSDKTKRIAALKELIKKAPNTTAAATAEQLLASLTQSDPAPVAPVTSAQDPLSSSHDASRDPCSAPALPGVDWRGCVLRGAVLSGAVLTNADLRGAVLSGAVLTNADLRGANLSGADLSDGSLFNANLANADLRGADLTRAFLRRADLRGADLDRANLRWADMAEANLTEASLTGAVLINAFLTNAKLRGADLFEADLTGAIWKYGKKRCAEGSVGKCK